MMWLQRVFWLVVALAALIVGIAIAMHNPQPVTLTLFSLQAPTFSLGTYALLLLAIGCLLGWVTSFGRVFWLKSQLANQKKRLNHAERELNALRTQGLRD